MSAATPAATPAMEMAVTTPTTACRLLALRYRAATKSSNRILPVSFLRACLLCCGGAEDGFGYADVVVAVVDAHGDEVFAGFSFEGLGGNLEVVVFTL